MDTLEKVLRELANCQKGEEKMEINNDSVKHPAHYTDGKIECIMPARYRGGSGMLWMK